MFTARVFRLWSVLTEEEKVISLQDKMSLGNLKQRLAGLDLDWILWGAPGTGEVAGTGPNIGVVALGRGSQASQDTQHAAGEPLEEGHGEPDSWEGGWTGRELMVLGLLLKLEDKAEKMEEESEKRQESLSNRDGRGMVEEGVETERREVEREEEEYGRGEEDDVRPLEALSSGDCLEGRAEGKEDIPEESGGKMEEDIRRRRVEAVNQGMRVGDWWHVTTLHIACIGVMLVREFSRGELGRRDRAMIKVA